MKKMTKPELVKAIQVLKEDVDRNASLLRELSANTCNRDEKRVLLEKALSYEFVSALIVKSFTPLV